LTEAQDRARAILRGDRRLLARLAAGILRVERDNLVARPWGGTAIPRFKNLPSGSEPFGSEPFGSEPFGSEPLGSEPLGSEPFGSEPSGSEPLAARSPIASQPFGEAFEISAYNADAEAARYPSRLRCDDGSLLELPALLEAHGEMLLGSDFIGRHGLCFPLLPKTLSVRELLSVQGHPAGNTEVYIIIDAEPGATLRLGFRRDIDPAAMAADLARGLECQRALLASLGPGTDAAALQLLVAPWLARRNGDGDDARLASGLRQYAVGSPSQKLLDLLAELKHVYWHVLDAMNEIAVTPGQVIYNATPARLLPAVGGIASAEVHALGNPEGREILALEVRRPGPTFRAWDNVRFPPREVDVEAALAALNLKATAPEEFMCEKRAVPDRAGAFVSVDCEYFRVEHLLPERDQAVAVPAAGPHSLHCLAGSVALTGADGTALGSLEQGESALVPVGIGGYRVESEAPAELIRVTLPDA